MSGYGTPPGSPRDDPMQESQSNLRFASLQSSVHEDEDGPQSQSIRRRQQADARREYGTMDNLNLRPQPSTRSSGADSPTSKRDTPDTATFPQLSPQTTRPKRPPHIRRTSTKPHKGEQFSVDDDPTEVEGDRTPAQTPRESRAQSTVRRRTTYQNVTQLPRLDSRSDEDEEENAPQATEPVREEVAEDAEDPGEATAVNDEDEDDDTASNAESFTLRDRQLAINETHPFGIRIWKPALYKKNRSVEKNAEEDIHSAPSQIVSPWLWLFNCLWTLFFGWWLAAAAVLGAIVCYLCGFASSARLYGKVFWGLAGYLFWPFGKFVKLQQDENYLDEDEGEGRSIGEYERWQRGDLEHGRLMFGPTMTHTGSILGRHRNSIDSASEHDSLIERSGRADRQETNMSARTKRRLFGRGQWTLGRVIFFVFFYFNVAPLLLLVSLTCWFLVFWIPMGRVTYILFTHLRKRPLALTFHRDVSHSRDSARPSSIIVCTYRAVGTKYWKYTVDGTNIFLINFLAVVAFVIFDYFVVKEALGLDFWLTSPGLLFTLALVSVIPLAYFIGQAVASISAQSTMGVGAAVNAFFSTIVEVYLYCVALNEGKGKLVEGSLVGSIFAGILLLPGLSMCFGAIKRKTQRFNVKSAAASSTMLLFATIAAFGPTLFYKIYGSHELICKDCIDPPGADEPRDCRRCYFRQRPAVDDEFFTSAVRPYCWLAAILLFSSYVIGLLFTLRTHAATIWNTDADEKRTVHGSQTMEVSPTDTRRPSTFQPASMQGSYTARSNIRDSQLYRRILGQSLRQAELLPDGDVNADQPHPGKLGAQIQSIDQANKADLPHVVPPKPPSASHSGVTSPMKRPVVPGLSEEDNHKLFRQVAEMAATAATVAARDAVANPRAAAYQASQQAAKERTPKSPALQRMGTYQDTSITAHAEPVGHAVGGHDAPNWSRAKSSIILLSATVAYAIVAEVLVDTVDVVLTGTDIDEKFLGITLFALVPNTTEFLNGISFAMNGNIALSMEIGMAYALQVCLLQIPAVVLFSAVHGRFVDTSDLLSHSFNLIFPQWDMFTTIICVFLLSYLCNEGKSNYFKGSILVMAYLVVLFGFYYSGYTANNDIGVDPTDTLALMSNMAWQHKTTGGVGSTAVRREL